MCDTTFEELLKQLCRALEVVGQTERILARIGNAETNLERVACVRQSLDEFQLFPTRLVEAPKSDEVSLKCREAGNELYKKKKDRKALEMYTKSAAFACEGGENLGLAIANRSAVLYQRKLYSSCIENIRTAIASNCPQRLNKKLEERRKNAETLLDQDGDIKYRRSVPQVSEANPKIPCASTAVTIQSTEEMGRHVLASRYITPGEVLAVEKPFAKILLLHKQFSHCHHCVVPSNNLIPCRYCTVALFCGQKCREEAWNEYHKYECPILPTLISLKLNRLQFLALRVAICARYSYKLLEEGFGDTHKNDVYLSENYKEIHQLIANTEKHNARDLLRRATAAAIVSHFLQIANTDFFDKYDRDIFDEVFLLHLQTGPSNFHEINELEGSESEHYYLEETGAGAYAFLSLLNHACSPNVVRHCYGSQVVLTALRPIKKGEQLFDNYGYHHAVMKRHERRDHLQWQYYFDCKCQACVEDWPLYQDLPEAGRDIGVTDEEIERLRNGCTATAETVLRKVAPKLEELEEFMPCEELGRAQEIFKQCLAILGNKRKKV